MDELLQIDVIVRVVVALALAVMTLSVFTLLLLVISRAGEHRVRRVREQLRRQLLMGLERRGGALEAGCFRHVDADVFIGVVACLAEELEERQCFMLPEVYASCGMGHLAGAAALRMHSRRFHQRLRTASYLPFIIERTEAIRVLIDALDDPMVDVRLEAAHSLGRLKAAEAVVPILEHLSLPGNWPLRRVTELIMLMEDAAVPPLLEYLSGDGGSIAGKVIAISALGTLEAGEASAMVRSFMKDPSPEIRIQAMRAAGSTDGMGALVGLRRGLLDPVWEVRASAAKALGKFPDEHSVSPLFHCLGDREWWVRFNAASSLLRQGPGGIAALRKALGHEDRFVREMSRMILEGVS
ncbi:MAG TPA: HEAT repeat domain-containing protein [Chlorobium sp.]|uniref:PBS lyase HEAT domain protein repeat-containing protein n=1 Tax=Chlorobium phaeovibrioides (strain DSM 265 / 1930) TaxID=290318 RepID=A4SFN7_CHLPM|nr:HEAT repeat domain-containing protein [Chlorobium sp.]